MDKFENEEWKLHCFLDWVPKQRAVTCDRCMGTGSVGGHFKDLDGPQPCPKCFGTGIQTIGPTSPRPEIPAELREHMRRAWFDFHHKEGPPIAAELLAVLGEAAAYLHAFKATLGTEAICAKVDAVINKAEGR